MKNYKAYLRYMGTCKFQNKLWFLNGGFNGLFLMNLDNFITEFKMAVPYLEKQIQRAYDGNVYCTYGNKIFFFPYNCKFVMVYDTQGNDIQEIPISTADGSDTYWTAGVIQCNEITCIFPIRMEQGIFVLDLREMQIIRDVELEKVLYDVEFIYNYENVVKLNETNFSILSGNHTIIGINIKTRKRTFTKWFDELDIWGIRYDGSNFWLLLYESTDIYKWNPEEDKLVKYHLLQEEWINGKGVPYSNMIFLNNQIILLPCCLKNIMRIDQETNTINKATEYPAGFHFFNGIMGMPAFASFDIIEQHKILIHPVRGNMLLIYDIERNYIEGRKLTVTMEEIPYLQEVVEQRFHQEAGIVQETDHFGLELLNLAIAQNKKNRNPVKAEQVGKKIYDSLVKQG